MFLVRILSRSSFCILFPQLFWVRLSVPVQLTAPKDFSPKWHVVYQARSKTLPIRSQLVLVKEQSRYVHQCNTDHYQSLINEDGNKMLKYCNYYCIACHAKFCCVANRAHYTMLKSTSVLHKVILCFVQHCNMNINTSGRESIKYWQQYFL